MTTHLAHAASLGLSLSVPCAAWHRTFAGHCLNCGWRDTTEARQLIHALRDGDSATLRLGDGSTYVGTAHRGPEGEWYADRAPYTVQITGHNLIGIGRRIS
jgi:hypothetical protein